VIQIQIMRKIFLRGSIFVLTFLGILLILAEGCQKDANQGYVPNADIRVTIYPNSTLYQELNIVGGWMYLGYYDGIKPPSRGVIVYRLGTDQFLAYERTPPFEPNACCNDDLTLCTALIVDQYYPFVADTCSGTKFLLIDGSVSEGSSPYPMVAYQTVYDGNSLFIHN